MAPDEYERLRRIRRINRRFRRRRGIDERRRTTSLVGDLLSRFPLARRGAREDQDREGRRRDPRRSDPRNFPH